MINTVLNDDDPIRTQKLLFLIVALKLVLFKKKWLKSNIVLNEDTNRE